MTKASAIGLSWAGPLSGTVAKITVANSSPIIFDIADGMDIGNYVAPIAKFTQRCIRVYNAALPHFFVDFRPDADGSRDEVIFWNGEVTPLDPSDVPSGHIRDLPSYSVTITKNGAVIYSATIPPHAWATRWRYQSSVRPLCRTASQVFSDKFFPNMSRKAARLDGYSGVIVPKTPPDVGQYSIFMPGNAASYKLGLLQYVDTGGERLELGAMTEWAADYLLNGTPSSLNAIRQHAEMVSSEWPFFLPDLNTGAAINFKQDLARYRTYVDSQDYQPYYRAAYVIGANGWDIHEGDAHMQMHPYIAYALTEDPYFLEGLQFIHTFGIGSRGTMYAREGNAQSTPQYGFGNLLLKPDGSGGINGPFTMCSYYGETRAVGLGVRNLAMAYKTALDNPPSWLLPKSYYATLSSDYSAVVQALFTTSPLHRHAIFRQLGADPYFQAFEQAYGIIGMAIADLVGMPTGSNPSWLTQLAFYFGMLDAVTNGSSGWNVQTPQPHDILNNADPENVPGGLLNFENYESWKELSDALQPFFKTYATFPNAPYPGNQQGGSMGNCSMMRAACAAAKSRGVPAASNALTYLDGFIDFNYPNNADASMGNSFEMKCGFDGT